MTFRLLGVVAFALHLVPSAAVGQTPQTTPVPGESEVLGLDRTADGAPVVVMRDGLARIAASGEVVTMPLSQPVDAFIAVAGGLPVALRADTLGFAPAGRPFAPLLTVPEPSMGLAAGDGGTLYVYSRATAGDGAGARSVYEIRDGRLLRRLAVLPDPIIDVATRGDTVYLALEAAILRLADGALEPVFASDVVRGIRAIDLAPDGPLLVATADGLAQLGVESAEMRWIDREPADDIVWTTAGVYTLDREARTVKLYRFGPPMR